MIKLHIPTISLKKWKRFVVLFIAVAILIVAGKVFIVSGKETVKEETKTAIVERRNIETSLSSSGSISPKDTYSITSLVDGEVLEANFEEGDQVEAGDILYVINSASMDSKLQSAKNSLERAQTSYSEAQTEYQDAAQKYSSNGVTATESGYVTKLNVKQGDTINTGSQIANVYDNRKMKLKIPFLSVDAPNIAIGSEAYVTLAESGEFLAGTVTAVSNMEETLTGNRLVRNVTILVNNPGGLTTSTIATAQVNDIQCSGEGTFQPYIEATIVSNCSGEIAQLYITEGDLLEVGTLMLKLDSSSVEKQLSTYKNTLQNAQENLEKAQTTLEDSQDSLDNYTITAPISGKVITKNVKVGDTLKSGNNTTTTLATIYDLSAVTFEMNIDELDVHSVSIGQSVQVTADAITNKTLTGTVTNVSLSSTSSQGVTNYPVTVLLDEVGELLPGMNVTGKIIIDNAENVLSIPVDSLMRGDTVYVKDDSATETQGNVPAGFKEVSVETGLISSDYIEITSGLSEGDEVYVTKSSAQTTAIQMPEGEQGGGFPGEQGGSQGSKPNGSGMPGGSRP